MTVYVDELRVWPYAKPPFTRGSCHLTADTVEELHAFAQRIGLRRAWFQAPQHARGVPHYDLTPKVRERAVAAGAVFVTARQQTIRRLHERGVLREVAALVDSPESSLLERASLRPNSGMISRMNKSLPKYKDKCRHFNGAQHAKCEAGVTYGGLPPGALPCLELGTRAMAGPEACASRSLLTQEEHAEREERRNQAVAAALEKLARGECLACGAQVEPTRRSGRCIYGACGHRIGQA